MDTHGFEERAASSGGTRSLSTAESWDLLRQAVVGRLAVIHDGAPDIFPVNYTVDHGTIVLRTAGGTKYEAARNQSVAFEVDGYDLEVAEAWSVVARGRAVEVRDVDDLIAVMGLPLMPWAEGSKPHFMRLEPETVTGRRIQVSGGVRRP
ncbi:pyridoxamine 5'-phosphate oxidase family protein [Knoellia locipacati]|uniref:pyridoxamine 5'-phosphate oxidase family protein n=1 Tax=Knoellia locipacati TaxID=882824 RepID=UPI003850A57D